MSVVDDYGRFEGRPELLRAKCFPLQVDQVRVADITRWMAACLKAGLILDYVVDGRRYIQLVKFGQPLRSPSKYPEPSANICEQMISSASKCFPATDTDTDTDTKKGSAEGGEYPEAFVRFWDKYPKKLAKEEALKAFKKVGPSEELLVRILNAVELHKLTREWVKDGGQFIPRASSWLNGKRWEDDHSNALKPDDFSSWGMTK